MKTLDPKFMPRFGNSAKASFANMIDMKFYGASDLVAEVIPEGDDTLARAIGGIGFKNWRFSRSGMTYLSSYKDRSIRLDVPDAEACSLSGSGSTIGRLRYHRPDVLRSKRA